MLLFLFDNLGVVAIALGVAALMWSFFLRIRDKSILKEALESDKDTVKIKRSSFLKSRSVVYDIATFFLFVVAVGGFLSLELYNTHVQQTGIVVIDSLDDISSRARTDGSVVNLREEIDFDIFAEVYYLLRENFPRFGELTREEIGYGITRGLISALGDPHTSFIDAKRSNVFMEDVSGEFQGIGIEIGMRNGVLQVISPITNTPAHRAGLRARDIIIEIDEESTEGMSLEEAVLRIRGPRGEVVKISVIRDGKVKDFSIIRDTIKIVSADWNMIDGNVAHLQIFHFNDNIRNDMSRIAREIVNSNAKSVIVDLRNNPGGVLGTSIDVIGYFIDRGEVAVIETDLENPENNNYLRAAGVPILKDYKMVILINEGSASASEIVAGALRDHLGAKVIGVKSFGKGSIQQIFHTKEGSLVKITVRYFLTPNEVIIDGNGIAPDYEVELDRELLETKEVDTQLQKALEVLRGL